MMFIKIIRETKNETETKTTTTTKTEMATFLQLFEKHQGKIIFQ